MRRHRSLSRAVPLVRLGRRFAATVSPVAILAGVTLGTDSASATDGTWAGPGSEWTTSTNWSSNPTVPDNTATFTNNSAPTSLTISNSPFVTTINEMLFTATAPAYSYAVNSTFHITGTGIVNNSAFAPTFSINGSSIRFESTSTAANAIINNNNTGILAFDFNSTAGSATINNLSTIFFSSFATAGNATINQGPAGTLNFFDLTTGGNATITNGGTVVFNDLGRLA